MNRVIFVHPRTAFLDRIKKESNEQAITTTSMLDALKWITNPIHHIAAIFLNPDDTTFSALHFIELTLNHRPTLPIYLLEGRLAQNKQGAERVTLSTNIKGIFSGSESYATMTAALRSNLPIDTQKPRPAPIKQIYAGYTSVPVSDFFTGTNYSYDIFLATEEGEVRLFAAKGSEIDADYLRKLAGKTTWLLVKDIDLAQTRQKIQETRATIASNKDIPAAWRSSEVMVGAKDLIEEIKKAGVADNMIAHTQNMLGDLYSLLNRLDSDSEEDDGNLFDIIDRAKKCDRTVFCATYSILLCKQMRYEKTATLEILGFASVLQDVSLYQTPYGDLSEKSPSKMNPEELQYYQKHPVMSSDLVAQHTDMPQVTLQVIRQAHERRDKSGFPNKIGGSILHAMAEMLSLINMYYDVTLENMTPAQMVEHMNRNVFPHFADNVVVSFKQVLGNILKDKVLADHAKESAS